MMISSIPIQNKLRRGVAQPVVITVLAIIVLFALWWGAQALSKAKPEVADKGMPQGPPPQNVILGEVKSLSSQQTHRVIGTLRARSQAEIAARESGSVLKLLVREGDKLSQGDVIARLDPQRLNAQIAEASAATTVSRALVTQRTAELERSATDLKTKEKLFAQKALSETELLDARRAADVAKALSAAASDSLTAAKARLELIQVRNADLEVRAPFAGRVVARHTEVGEWVNPGDPVVTLVSSGPIEAWLQVPERFATAAQGQSISVTLSATGEVVKSKSLIPVPAADSSTRTVPMIALLENPKDLLLPGLSVSAELPVMAQEKRLAIPINALTQSYGGPAVFVPMKKEGSPIPIAHRVPVTVLYQEKGLVYISSKELKVGDQIVTEGNERLFPTQPLLIREVGKTQIPTTK